MNALIGAFRVLAIDFCNFVGYVVVQYSKYMIIYDNIS